MRDKQEKDIIKHITTAVEEKYEGEDAAVAADVVSTVVETSIQKLRRVSRAAGSSRVSDRSLSGSDSSSDDLSMATSITMDQLLLDQQACDLSGFPPALYESAGILADKAQLALSFRAGAAPNIFQSMKVAFKPMSVKTKTTVLPGMSGFILEDQPLFGRPDSKGLTVDEAFSLRAHRVTLRCILDGVLKGNFEVYPEYSEQGQLSRVYYKIRPNAIEADKSRDVRAIIDTWFAIDISKGQQPEIDHVRDMADILGERVNDAIRAQSYSGHNDFIKDVHLMINGTEHDNYTKLFEVHYSSEKKPIEEMQALNVLTDSNKRPVTGDADGFMWSDALKGNKASERAYNIAELARQDVANNISDQLKDFSQQVLEKLQQYNNDLQLDFDEMENHVKAQGAIAAYIQGHDRITGIATPSEVAMAIMMNKITADTIGDSKQFSQLILHGPETNNPGVPSALNGDIFHVLPGGIKVLTRNEAQLIDLYMGRLQDDSGVYIFPDFISRLRVPIHPQWDMALWGEVIIEKLRCRQEVLPATLCSYVDHYIKNDDAALLLEDFAPAISYAVETLVKQDPGHQQLSLTILGAYIEEKGVPACDTKILQCYLTKKYLTVEDSELSAAKHLLEFLLASVESTEELVHREPLEVTLQLLHDIMQRQKVDSIDHSVMDVIVGRYFSQVALGKSAVSSAPSLKSVPLDQGAESKEETVAGEQQHQSSFNKGALKAALGGAVVLGAGVLVVATHGLATPILAKVVAAKAAAGALTGAAVGGGCRSGLVQRAKSRLNLGRPSVFTDAANLRQQGHNKENDHPTLRKTQSLPEL